MSEFVTLPLPAAIKVIEQRLALADEDIAGELGVGIAAVRSWRTGRHRPLYRSIRPLQAIARRANVGIDPSSMAR